MQRVNALSYCGGMNSIAVGNGVRETALTWGRSQETSKGKVSISVVTVVGCRCLCVWVGPQSHEFLDMDLPMKFGYKQNVMQGLLGVWT